MSSDIRGVFNFTEDFPAPHMVRIRLRRESAWRAASEIIPQLQSGAPTVDFAWFGTLVRDAEEDLGRPVEVEE